MAKQWETVNPCYVCGKDHTTRNCPILDSIRKQNEQKEKAEKRDA